MVLALQLQFHFQYVHVEKFSVNSYVIYSKYEVSAERNYNTQTPCAR